MKAAAIGLGAGALAVAVWLVPASVHIVEWTTAGPHRVALLASRALLVALAVAALLAGAALAASTRTRHADAVARAAAWLCLLWLWAVPFAPWLPDRFPLLLIFAGPAKWLVAALVGAGIGSIVLGPRLQSALSTAGEKVRPTIQVISPRRAVFTVSLVAYLLFGALHARSVGPGGDEPHYLVISHSILTDGDLLIENNHVERDYLPFFGGNLRPDYMRRGQNGQIYSIHAPGLPVLVLPVYAAGGYGAVVALLCLMAALTALAIFDLANALVGARAALIAWAAVCLTVPFLPHAWMIFPELPGALAVAWASLWLWRGGAVSARSWVWRGIVLAALPWLHTKFIIFTAIYAAALCITAWRSDPGKAPRRLAAFGAPMAISIAGWLYSFWVLYGTIDPEAPYGDYPKMFVLMRNIPRGLLGLIFDQKFGLLIYAPVYAFAIAGCWLMLRRADWRWPGAVLLLATAAHVGSTTRLYMWWGGSSAPARFLVPILPCLAPMIAVAAARFRSAAARVALWGTLAISVALAIVSVAQPARLLLFSDARGRGRIVELLQGPAPLAYLLPTFTFEDWQSPLVQLLPWLLAVGVAFAAVVLLQRVRPGDTGVTLVAAATLAFAVAASLIAAPVPRDARAEAARRGAADLIWRYDAARLRPVSYGGRLVPTRLDQNEVLALGRIVVDRPPDSRDANQRIVAGPFALPPGGYEARVWFDAARPREGELIVSLNDRAIFGRTREVAANPVVVPFQLPVAVGRLTVGASAGALAAAVTKVEILPAAVVPPRDRPNATVRTIESIPDHAGAFIVYVNEHTYPEGGIFWTRGTGAGSVLVAPGGARRMTLTLFSGPVDADVSVTIDRSERRLTVHRGEPTVIPFSIPPGASLVPITVQSASFFRPSELDPQSTDSRGLGCQVRIELE